jgi:hypothetical protein
LIQLRIGIAKPRPDGAHPVEERLAQVTAGSDARLEIVQASRELIEAGGRSSWRSHWPGGALETLWTLRPGRPAIALRTPTKSGSSIAGQPIELAEESLERHCRFIACD